MMRVQDEMLERTEGGVALARVGRFARAAHVQNHARIGQVFGDIDDALQLVHGLDAAHAFDFANGKREPPSRVALRSRLLGAWSDSSAESVSVQGLGHGLNFGARGVIEMASGTENFQTLETCARNLAKKFGSNFSGNE